MASCILNETITNAECPDDETSDIKEAYTIVLQATNEETSRK